MTINRQYLGVSTQGKVFGDIFDNARNPDKESDITKFFPKETLYRSLDQEVVRWGQ